MKNQRIRCNVCGKFISYSDIENGKVYSKFTPDTQFTIEKTEWFHIKCNAYYNYKGKQ